MRVLLRLDIETTSDLHQYPVATSPHPLHTYNTTLERRFVHTQLTVSHQRSYKDAESARVLRESERV